MLLPVLTIDFFAGTILALEEMLERDVMHRDISRGNVLCHPRHTFTEKGKKEKRCEYIAGMLYVPLPMP